MSWRQNLIDLVQSNMVSSQKIPPRSVWNFWS